MIALLIDCFIWVAIILFALALLKPLAILLTAYIVFFIFAIIASCVEKIFTSKS